ncbi:Protein CBG25241 [Caenorhabditis briggsae]|uniref:Protein CBG25241 n=1 Tax=Caenorhabditis briggsae TaxID=6238 RepID=B6IFL1_CAEBR|nr:Protein CBG25241 [Caenorhabditis briggsae]CAR98691.1 Protein CBG25241 [Caenorhabditis briggsae]
MASRTFSLLPLTNRLRMPLGGLPDHLVLPTCSFYRNVSDFSKGPTSAGLLSLFSWCHFIGFL